MRIHYNNSVLPLKRCLYIPLINIDLPTNISTDERGSSNKNISASFFLYKLRAKPTLIFCPPDKLAPFSPISVLSPFAKRLKSDINDAE